MKLVLSVGLLLLLLISFTLGALFPINNASSWGEPQQSFTTYEFTKGPITDFTKYTDIKQKKHAFFIYLLPRVRAANTEIKQQRQWLKSIDPSLMSTSEQNQFLNLIEIYEVKESDPHAQYQELLIRVNAIPASLVLAQAANESAWGTSRFARDGNNLFGQWCYVKGCGIVPKKRTHGQSHEVAKFGSVYDSIKSYMRNLNSQFSYADLRALRAKSTAKGKSISGYKLANGLLAYSTRREAYVKEIQAMIKSNQLEKFD